MRAPTPPDTHLRDLLAISPTRWVRLPLGQCPYSLSLCRGFKAPSQVFFCPLGRITLESPASLLTPPCSARRIQVIRLGAGVSLVGDPGASSYPQPKITHMSDTPRPSSLLRYPHNK